MNQRTYSLSINYRMTCEKSDPRNYCTDRTREKGFYWLVATREELSDELDKMGLTNDTSLDTISEKLKNIQMPSGCEAIQVKLRVCLPGSTGVNGGHRDNVEFEFFNDLIF